MKTSLMRNKLNEEAINDMEVVSIINTENARFQLLGSNQYEADEEIEKAARRLLRAEASSSGWNSITMEQLHWPTCL